MRSVCRKPSNDHSGKLLARSCQDQFGSTCRRLEPVKDKMARIDCGAIP